MVAEIAAQEDTARETQPAPRFSAGRMLAGIGGAFVLVVAALITFGTALIAPVGMLLAGLFYRRKNTTLTLWSSWLGAVGAVSIALLIGAGGALVAAPNGTVAKYRHSIDSLQAHPDPKARPAWAIALARPNRVRNRKR